MENENAIRIIAMSDVHYCKDGWYGVSQETKRERICSDLESEYEKNPYQALLLLGDYSLDYWEWATKGTYLTKGHSDTKLFREQCLKRIAPNGVSARMIPGNHEQYGKELWKELTGFNRSDYLICGPILFLLQDTFGGNLNPTEHSDGTYSGVNLSEVKELMARYPQKKVVLCAHWFDIENESEEFRRFLQQEDRVLCLLCGHTHLSRITSTGERCGNKPVLYTGHYSYSGEGNVVRCLSGYRELCITENTLTSKYIVPPHTYTVDDVTFTTEYAEQDAIILQF